MYVRKMTRTERIRTILTNALSPEILEIEDESAAHAGHNPAAANGETHYHLRIKAAKFEGLSRVDQHRIIYDLLARELYSGLHALRISTIVN